MSRGRVRRRLNEEFEGFGEVVGEQVDDFLREVAALIVLGGLGLLAWWGWGHSRVATLGVGVALAPLLLYGLVNRYRWWIAEPRPVNRRRLAAAVLTTALVVAGWLGIVIATDLG